MADFDPEVFDTLCNLLAVELGANRDRLTPDLALIDLELDEEEYHRLYERMAEETGVNLNNIINSMPIYSIDESEWTMTSLQNWAAFSEEYAAYLDRCDVRTEKETLRSIAATFSKGKYVSSGQFFDPIYPPRSNSYVLMWSFVLVGVVGLLVPAIFVLWPCDPFSADCRVGPAGRFWQMFRFSGSFAVIMMASAWVPGWWAMKSKKKRLKRRGSG